MASIKFTTPSVHFVSKNVMETELGEALNDKIYLKSDGGPQLVNPASQRVLVIVYRRFGTNYLSHFSWVKQFTFS